MYEQIVNLQREMQETRSAVRRYNGLYEKLDRVDKKVLKMEAELMGSKAFGRNIREWGGWIIAVITLILTLYRTLGG